MSNEKEAEARILQYMMDANRPYSAIDVTNNLHKAFGKTCVQRVLDLLVSQDKLTEKVYGKQKVYTVNQSLFPDVSSADLKEMEKKISMLQEGLRVEEEAYRALETRLSSLKSSLTSEEAKKQLEELDIEVKNYIYGSEDRIPYKSGLVPASAALCAQMEGRLTAAKSNKDAVSPEESKKIGAGFDLSVKHWKKRKRMATDIVSAILEDYPKSKKMLLEEIGIETDEDYKLSIPT